jgi:hypothetical protein
MTLLLVTDKALYPVKKLVKLRFADTSMVYDAAPIAEVQFALKLLVVIVLANNAVGGLLIVIILEKVELDVSDIFKQNQSFNKNTTDQATSQSGENNQGDKPAVMQLGDSTTTNQDDISKNLNESLSDVKSLLARIAMLLEGPLEFSPMDAPFRPDSRKV